MTETEARAFLVQTARKYLGCRESDGSHRKIIDIYNGIRPLPRSWKMPYSGQNSAWCATFVSAMAKLCGMLDIIPAECSCYFQLEAFRSAGRWMERDEEKRTAQAQEENEANGEQEELLAVWWEDRKYSGLLDE